MEPHEKFPGRVLDFEFGGKRITLNDLLQAAARVVGILTDVDANTTKQSGGSIDWVIRDLKRGSAIFEVEAQPKAQVDERFWAPEEVVYRFKAGMRQVVERGERPSYFSERAMQHAVELTNLLNINGIDSFRVGYNGESVELTPEMKKAVRETLEGRYTAIGSIEGRIEALSAHEPPPFYCTVYTVLTEEAIRCNFNDRDLLEKAYQYFRQRVTLRGVLNSRADGEVTSMRVTSIEPFPADDELPDVDDILGIMANGT